MSAAELDEAFLAYCNFGQGNARNKTEMESRQFKKMCQEAKLFNKGKLNGAEVDMIYTRCKSTSKKIPVENFRAQVIPQMAQAVYGSASEGNQDKVANALLMSAPGLNTALNMSKDDVVNRLTDTKGYTGAHKSRFDESGQGRGLEGRVDRVDGRGYVGGYKNEGTYGKK